MSYPSGPNQSGGYPPPGGYPPQPPPGDYPPSYGQPSGYGQPPYGQAPRSGLVRQVPTLGILMMVQGGLELVLGLIVAFLGPAIFAILQNSPEFSRVDKSGLSVVTGVYLVEGIAFIAVAALRLFAGFKIRKYQGKTLGIISLAVGLITALGCYCAPTAIGLLIYGLIVLMNEDVNRAFDMGEQGATPQDIQRAFYGY